mmetsp:Transcript_8642/g.13128  ORF Transcript_8642/g.13128 Transcript_8642/m.13128 type:complete len:81 (-) Transcript_8642:457-699(-)
MKRWALSNTFTLALDSVSPLSSSLSSLAEQQATVGTKDTGLNQLSGSPSFLTLEITFSPIIFTRSLGVDTQPQLMAVIGL